MEEGEPHAEASGEAFADAVEAFTPKERMLNNWAPADRVNTKLEICAFSVCLLAEKILCKDMSNNPMKGDSGQYPDKYQNAESIFSACTAAVQIVNTKGKTTNSKGEKIKVTTNFVNNDTKKPEEIDVDLGFYDVWKQIAADLGFNISDKGNVKIVNEFVAGEAIYRDLDNITHTQQTGTATAQLGNAQFYPHYLCNGSKSATMAAKIDCCGFMAGLNEVLRIKNVLANVSGNKGPNGETEGMLNYMKQALISRLPGGHGWVVNTLVESAGGKDKSILNALKTCLGSYLGKVTPKRGVPDIPQLFVFYCGTVLQTGIVGAGSDKDFARAHQIFNSAWVKLANCGLETYSFQHAGVNLDPRRLDIMFVHYSGMTFGNLDVCSKYLNQDGIFENGLLSFGNLFGNLNKMGKFNYAEKNTQFALIHTPLVSEPRRINVDFKRNVKSAAVERYMCPSLPTDMSGDANQTFYLAQPVSTTDASVAPYEYAQKMATALGATSEWKKVTGQVTPTENIMGIIMNYSPRKHGTLSAKWKLGFSKLFACHFDTVMGYDKDIQHQLALALNLVFDDVLQTGSFQQGLLEEKVVVAPGVAANDMVVGEEMWKRVRKLEQDFGRAAKKMKRATGYDGGDVDY